MKFVDDFEKREWLGREALKEVQELYPGHFKYEFQFTTGKYDGYDAFYFIIDKDTLKIKKRVLIEIKIRDTSFEEYILEQKKYNKLLKLRESLFFTKEEMSILYINFTPGNTIIWNLDQIVFKKEKLVANKETSVSRKNKISKTITYLKPSDGKVLEYILNERHLIAKSKIEKVIEVVKKEIKGLNFLFK